MGQSKLVRRTGFLIVAVISMMTAPVVRGADIDSRMSIIEAIDAIRERGVEVSYSSQLVKPWMRVRSAPENSEPIAALREVLEAYRLTLEEGPSNRWLVVQDTSPLPEQVYFVRGQVTDATTGSPLGKARIESGENAVLSGRDGRFELQILSEDEVEIDVTADGYLNYQSNLEGLSGGTEIGIALRPIVLRALEEIVIVASRHSMFSRNGASGQFLTGDDIRQMPHIADDAFRALHRLPGVAANDFQAPFNLRGGANDEVKVVMDGLELFEPYHMRTLFNPLSIIDPGIIGEAKVFSGGFTADYGNQMSGIVEIESDRPDGEPVHQLGVSFVNSFARSSGTFGSGDGTYQFSARRGYLDLLADAVTSEGEELSPGYNDVFAKVNYRLNDTIDLSANVLAASDDVTFVDPADGEDFGEDSSLSYAWLTVNVEPNDELSVTNLIFAGSVETNENGILRNPPFEIVDRHFRRNIDISGLQSDLSWQFSDRAMWKLGLRYRNLSADYDYHIDSLRQTDIANNGAPYALMRDIVTSREGDEIGAYAAYRFRIQDRLSWELGLRWDKQTYSDTSNESQLSPRINGLYEIGDRTEMRLGWGHNYQPQGIQELQVQDGVTQFFPAQRAEHWIVGFQHRYDSGLELQADIYQKRYSDLRPRFENAFDTYEFAPESNFDRLQVDPDSAKTHGVEITLRNRKSMGLDWWFNYTWSEAKDTIDGVSVRRSWDQRHAVTGNLTWRGEKWTLSTVARYHSGWPRTPLLVLPIFDSGGGFIGANSDLSQRNQRDFNDYSRVDLRLSRTVELARSRIEYYFEIYNLFNVSNECCVPDHELEVGQSVVVSPNIDDYLPFFPSFGFVWTFGPGVKSGSR